ncbi:MAG: hypothetical protein EPN17_10300 [Methylobacter sp.]|nr:MAG: hypothetical protein EPN17_10300 [Methylobacter sp.]
MIDGGVGIDTWKDDFSALTSTVSVTLTATTGANTGAAISLGSLPVPTVKNVEKLNLSTGSGNDSISVGTLAYNDNVSTGSGTDTINVGTGGSDYVNGGDGVDLGYLTGLSRPELLPSTLIMMITRISRGVLSILIM